MPLSLSWHPLFLVFFFFFFLVTQVLGILDGKDAKSRHLHCDQATSTDSQIIALHLRANLGQGAVVCNSAR
jgi:hypothetical protein